MKKILSFGLNSSLA